MPHYQPCIRNIDFQEMAFTKNTVGYECFFFNSALREMVTFSVPVTGVPNLHSLLVKCQIDNPSPGAVTGEKLVPSSLKPV